MMYGQFLKYINEQRLFGHNERLLLGVSGGVDSVVLAHLINQRGNLFAIAHCNFKLRGEESQADAQFVFHLAEHYGVPFFTIDFDTEEYAQQKGVSIEMAARELRYNWFEEIRKTHEYDYIVVGHHLDDVFETFLLNLSRGTGIRGLSGIKARAGKVVRPLLFALRSEIETYACAEELKNRYDATNGDTLIKRNLIRHDVMPILEQLNPAFKRNFQKTIAILQQTEQIFQNEIERARDLVFSFDDDLIQLSISELLNLNPLASYLFEFLRPFGFNAEQCDEISLALGRESGRKFLSPLHRLIVDRNFLIVSEIVDNLESIFYIHDDDLELFKPLHLQFKIESNFNKQSIERKTTVAQLDYDCLVFPLVLRKWKVGEYFKPLGMTGMKKISDFFIDQKLSIPEKENTWLLLSENKVVWIVGLRIDDRFKLTDSTKKVFRIDICS